MLSIWAQIGPETTVRRVMRHMSHVTHHVSGVMCHFLFGKKIYILIYKEEEKM